VHEIKRGRPQDRPAVVTVAVHRADREAAPFAPQFNKHNAVARGML